MFTVDISHLPSVRRPNPRRCVRRSAQSQHWQSKRLESQLRWAIDSFQDVCDDIYVWSIFSLPLLRDDIYIYMSLIYKTGLNSLITRDQLSLPRILIHT
jgi:hypothetical protein